MAGKKLYAEIGQRLYKQRKKMNLTQEKVAEMLGISTTYYGAIERGDKRISLEKVLLVYRTMNLDPTYLLTGKKNNDPALIELFEACPKEKQEALEQALTYLVELSK